MKITSYIDYARLRESGWTHKEIRDELKINFTSKVINIAMWCNISALIISVGLLIRFYFA